MTDMEMGPYHPAFGQEADDEDTVKVIYGRTASYPDVRETIDWSHAGAGKLDERQELVSVMESAYDKPTGPQPPEDDGVRLDNPEAIRRRHLDKAVKIAEKILKDIDVSLDHLDVYDSNAPGAQLDTKLRIAAEDYLTQLRELAARAERLAGG